MGQSESQSIYEACLAAIQVGNLTQAQALLQPLLATGKDAEALRLRALIEVRQNEPAKAVTTLQQALRIEQNPVLLANLANALVYAGDHAKAENVCRQALAMEALPEVCNTLGSLLAMRKAYQEAVVSFEQALALRPDYTQARCNLANANFLSGNIERVFEDCFRLIGYDAMPRQSFEDALVIITDGMANQPSLGQEVVNTVKELAYWVLPARAWPAMSATLTQQSLGAALHYEAHIRAAIGHWLTAAYPQFEHELHRAAQQRDKGIRSSKGLKSLAAYERYLLALKQTPSPLIADDLPPAAVVGDSHVLSWNGQRVSCEGQSYRLEAELVMGAKAFHIADARPNRFLWRLRQMLARIPRGMPLVFSFGEIDCRLDEGLLPFIQKTGASLTETVKSQVAAYAKAVRGLLPKDCPAAWLIAVPAPNIASLQTTFPNTDTETFAQLKEIIRQWNASLQAACQSLGLGFVDVYGLTVDANGVSNGRWHCDGVHLLPEALKAAHWIAPATAETPEALNAQGAQLAEQKRYAEAEECFLRALALRPDYVDARINLSAVQLLGCKPEMAWAGTLAMLGYPPEPLGVGALKAMGARILDEGFGGQAGQFNTLKELAYNGLPVRDWGEWNQLLSRPRNRPDLRHEGAVRQAITAWLQQTPAILEQALTLASTLRAELPQNKSNRNLVAFANYLGQLQQRFPQSKRHGKKLKPLRMQALGDSHVLSWHGLVVQKHKSAYAISAELVMGAKAFHIGHSQRNHYQDRLKRMLAEVPADTALLLSCGEIDCRLTEGLMPFLQKTGQAMEVLVTEQVTRYVRAITLLVTGRRAPIWLTGVPAPLHKHLRLRHPDFDEAVWQRHVDLIRQWNQQLAKACAEAGYGFVDLYALTAEPDGTANGQWHCDSVHLLPTALQAAPWVEPKRPPTTQAIAGFAAQANQALAAHRLADAERVFRQVIALGGALPEAHNNLGSVLKEQGRLGEAQAAFEQAVTLRPDYASAHSNWLFTLQYASGQTLAKLRAAHEDWARQQLQGITPADPAAFERKGDGPIVVGLVSPDLYAHPVGVFLLPWLERHDRGRFQLIAYADSERDDPIARRIRAAVEGWRPIAGQDDEAVAKQIAADRVDILIDLAGHTAGNRLKLFARRAAPIQVSWLGYSATTGVPAMDAVLMDAYTAPPGVEAGFTEQLVRLDGLRFCYTPPEYAPAVSSAPISQKGYVTFGSFNNLAKVTPEVIEAWAAILKAVPAARLVLKWKSLGDAETRERLVATFVQHGIDAARIECRGWSSHPQMLAEYGEIDIALDPFPFSGGLTSCDALYMGVPVLTLPGELPISRQTGSFLDALRLTDWIASSREDYIDKAVNLANRADLLESLRQSLREKMLASRLCDGTAYARAIESALSALHAARCQPPNTNTKDLNMKTFLHIGCGPKRKDQTTRGFNTDEWQELRFDIDESVKPDLVGTMTDMSTVADESVDAIFSSHNIEHLYPHEVPLALKEFLRVLKPDGFLVVTCPDLQSVCQLVAEDKLTEAAYTSPAGPIAPLDILYGHRPAMAKGNLFMAHRCGFTSSVLSGTLQASGFRMIAVRKRPAAFDLWAVASKSERSEEALRALAAAHFPAQPGR